VKTLHAWAATRTHVRNQPIRNGASRSCDHASGGHSSVLIFLQPNISHSTSYSADTHSACILTQPLSLLDSIQLSCNQLQTPDTTRRYESIVLLYYAMQRSACSRRAGKPSFVAPIFSPDLCPPEELNRPFCVSSSFLLHFVSYVHLTMLLIV
jgi:hypothetical protein